MTKKTLVAKLSFDVTNKSDTLIELTKAVIHQTFIEGGMEARDINFEVLATNEEDRVASMFKAVQNEFKAASTALELSRANEEEITESEKSDGIADFLSLVFSGFFDEDEEDEESDDDE